MKPIKQPSEGGQGWRVVVDELQIETRVGLYEHEFAAPQPVCIDANLRYGCSPRDSDVGLINYESWCNRITAYLIAKPHTRLLETLAVEIAAVSFAEWPALDAIKVTLHKPKVRQNAKRLALELDWHRTDYDAWCAGTAIQDFANQ
jgi:dihydroneopterin aldolase